MKINEKLGEILQLCLQLQDSGWGDVFYKYSGHVNSVNVYGYKGGHTDTGKYDFDLTVYLNGGLIDEKKHGYTSIERALEILKSYVND